MKFLLDQNMERRGAIWLKDQGHDVKVGVVDYPGVLPDLGVLDLALRDDRILLTNDRDFGELVVRRGLPHRGVIFFRMPAATAEQKIERL